MTRREGCRLTWWTRHDEFAAPGLAAPRTASERPRKLERAATHLLSVRESVGATDETSEPTRELDAAEAAMADRKKARRQGSRLWMPSLCL